MNYPPLILCSSISTLLPFLSSFLIIKNFNKHSRSQLFLWIFFALAVLVEISLFILNSLGKQSAWVFPIYTLVEYVLITIVIAGWQSKLSMARVMRVSIPIYILLSVFINVIGLESFSIDTVNYVTRPLAIFLIGSFAFLDLQALWSQTLTNITSDYRFWMLLAMALYYSSSLIVFAFMFTKDRGLLLSLLEIHAVVNIIHNILFTIGIFKVRGGEQAAIQPTSAS